MKQVRLDLPELGMIIGTRAILGAGVALLLADLFTRDQRRTIGATLTVIGLLTTIPAVWAVCGNLEKK
jgi:multisubunit Na+/H+ antiporter MnhG subunit